eukprot:2871443-Pyramimonas_sp.AAC.1
MGGPGGAPRFSNTREDGLSPNTQLLETGHGKVRAGGGVPDKAVPHNGRAQGSFPQGVLEDEQGQTTAA